MHSIVRSSSRFSSSHLYVSRAPAPNLNKQSRWLQTANDCSIDKNEVNKFNAAAKDWWGEHGPVGPLHAMNEVRVQWMKRVTGRQGARQAFDGLHIADVGAGGGVLSEVLCRLGAKVTAIEPAPESASVALRHAAQDPRVQPRLTVRNTTAENIAKEGQQFDVVTAMEVIEHVQNIRSFAGTLWSLTRPGGYVFLTTINRTSASYITAILLGELAFRLVPLGTHDWLRFPTPEELTNAFALAATNSSLSSVEPNLLVADQIGFLYNPLTRTWSTTSSMLVNYGLCFKKLR